LLADAAQLPERTATLLLAHAVQMRQTEGLARVRADAPLPQPPHLAAPSSAQLERLRRLFEALEFKSLLPRLDKLPRPDDGGAGIA
jgi:hypothetical protein